MAWFAAIMKLMDLGDSNPKTQIRESHNGLGWKGSKRPPCSNRILPLYFFWGTGKFPHASSTFGNFWNNIFLAYQTKIAFFTFGGKSCLNLKSKPWI